MACGRQARAQDLQLALGARVIDPVVEAAPLQRVMDLARAVGGDDDDRRLGRRDHFPVDESLYQVGFHSGLDLLSTYAGTATDLKPWLADAQINRDRNLRLQYLAGMAAHDYREAVIYSEMLKYRRYPDKLFVATTASTQELRRRLRLPGSDQ